MTTGKIAPVGNSEILVVEDNVSSLKMLSDLLTGAGYRVRPASDGELGLRSVQAKQPDLILLDFKLPGMDGVEVCRHLKDNPRTCDIPVIFISALGDSELKVKALDSGAIDYVTKPIDATEVLARINTHLSVYRMQRELEAQAEELEKHRKKLEVLVQERTAELRDSEQRAHVLLNASTELAMLMNPEGVVVAANQAAADRFGLTPNQLVGRSPFDLASPEVGERRLKVFQQIVEGSKPVRFEDENRGTLFDNSVYPLLDDEGNVRLVALFAADITERRQAEEERERARKFMQTVIDGFPEALTVVNRDYTIALANRTVREMSGGRDPVAAGLKCHQVSHSRETPCEFNGHTCLLSQVLETKESVTVEHVHHDAQGRPIVADVIAAPIFGEHGEVVQIIESARDITDRKRAEEKIAASLKEKEVLLREIHHRVKNNMQIIVSMLRMHARQSVSEQMRSVFDDCRNRVNAMALIHEALYQSEDLARIDSRSYFKKLFRNLSQAHCASSSGIVLSVGKQDVQLGMDQAVAVGMIVCELLSNIFKHAFPRGRPGVVSVSLSNFGEEEVELIVEDDGVGLPPEIDILNSPSLGLRLAAITTTHDLGGSIEVERDRGTRFVIHFKRKEI